MPMPRPASPILFEPLSPIPSEVVAGHSDSEGELDDAAQVAKRRRIERLGQSYLEGKPLFILSASLQGPFEDGWVNPWRKPKMQREDERQNAKDVSSKGTVSVASNIPDITAEYRRDNDQTVISIPSEDRHNRSTSSRKQIQQGGPSVQWRGKRYSVHERQISGSRDGPRQDLTKRPSRRPRSNEEILFCRPRAETGSGDNWLKRNKSMPHNQVLNVPQSPSPAPRHGTGAGTSKPSLEIIRNDIAVAPRVAKGREHLSTSAHSSGFTPINSPKYLESNLIKAGVPRSRCLISSVSGSGLGTGSNHRTVPREAESRFSKPGAPASATPTLGHPDSEHKNVPSDLKPSRTPPSVYKEPQGSSPAVPPSNDLPEPEHLSLSKSSCVVDIAAKAKPKQSPPRGQDDNVDGLQIGLKIKYQHLVHDQIQLHGGKDEPEAGYSIKRNTGNGQCSSRHDSANNPTVSGRYELQDGDSELVGTDNITSAQIIPEYAILPNPIISLYSTDPMDTNADTIEAKVPREGQDGQLSTQIAVGIAQRLVKDDLAVSAKNISTQHIESLDGQAVNEAYRPPANAGDLGKIRPFHILNTPSLEAPYEEDMNHTRTADLLTDGTRPSMKLITHDFSTAKTDRTGRTSKGALGDEEVLGNVKQWRARFIPRMSPSRDEQQAVQLQLDDLDMETSHESNNLDDSAPITRHGASVGFADESSLRASSTALPLALTTSTTLTRQQDAQGPVVYLEDFNLSQAIADAGSFLQSWDIEKELNSGGNKTGSSSSAPLQSILSVNAIHHG